MSNIDDKEKMKKPKNKHSIKNGIEELKCNQWKSIFVFTYLIITPFILKGAFTLISMIPDSTPMGFPLIDKITDIVTMVLKYGLDICALVLVVLGFFQVIVLIGKYHFRVPQDERFLDTPLVNRQGQPPEYLYKYKDKTRKHGQVLVYDKKGMKKEKFIDEIESIEYVLKKYKVYKIRQYGNDNSLIHIFRIQSKYAKPINVSKDTRFQDMVYINLLLTGSSGSGKSTALLTLMQIFSHSFPNGKITLISYKPTEIFVPFRETGNYYEYDKAKERFFKGL